MNRSARSLVGIALSWVSLAALVYVPSSDGGPRAAILATLGFLAFAGGLKLILESLTRGIADHLRGLASRTAAE